MGLFEEIALANEIGTKAKAFLNISRTESIFRDSDIDKTNSTRLFETF